MSIWDGLRSAVRIIGGTVLIVAGFITGQTWMISGGLALLSYEGQSQAARTARNKARDAYNESLQDRKQMVRSATAERRVVLGRSRVSGPMLYAQSTGTKSEYLHIIVALAGHECAGIEEVWLGDTKLPDPDGSGNILTGPYAKGTVGTATEGSAGASITLSHTPTAIKSVVIRGGRGGAAAVTYTQAGNVVTFVSDTGSNVKTVVYEYDQPGTPLVRIKKYLGTSTQTADADLVSESGGKWTSAHRLRGICYLYVRLQYDQDVFGATGIPNISCVVRGAKLYDPRKDSTAGGSGSHRLATPSTWQWAENSALALAWYLRDAQYGLGCAAAEIPASELIAAANICDQAVAIDTGLTQPRYTCNGALSSADTALANKEAIEQSMAGKAVWTQGRWLILPGAAQAIDRDITETDVADGSITIIPAQARQRLRNRIVPTYMEPEQQWAEMQAPAATRTGYVTADGGFDVPEEITWRMVTGSLRAQRLAYVELDRARQAMLVDLPCKLRAYNILPGRWVTLSLARYGWSAKTFEVISRRLDLGKMQTLLRLQEIADVYTPDYTDLGDVDLTPNTSLPSATALPPTLTGLAIATGTNHLLLGSDGTITTRGYLTWAQSTSVWVTQGGSIEVETMRADGDASTDWVRHAPVAGSSVSTYLAPLEDQRLTLARLRPVTNRGRAGLWSYILFLPLGKSQPPSNVSGQAYTALPGGGRIKWTRPTDLDWSETEWRLGASWAAGTRVFRGSATEFTLVGQAISTVQLWGVNYDTSQNASTTPTNLAVVITETTEDSLDALALAVSNAQADADTANTALANIASDSILSPSEKPSVVQDYAVITGEQAGVDAQATAYGVTTEKTAYDTAVSALTTYLGTLSGWNTVPGSDVAIVGTTFRGKFADVYTARQALLNKIAAVAGTLSNWGGVTGRPLQFRVAARGANDASAPLGTGLFNGETGGTLYGAGRSYMLVAISRSTGAVAYSRTYDVYAGGSAAGDMASDLNAQDSSRIVVIYTSDEPQGHRFDSGLDAAMYRCGASRAVYGSPNFRYRSAYILVGIGGCGEGNGYEAYQGDFDNSTNAWCDVAFSLLNGSFTIGGSTSTPRTLADYSYTGDLNATNGAPAGTLVAGTAAATVRDNAANALANAATAQGDANSALTKLATMRSNGYLDAAEKPAIIREWTALQNEQSGIDSQATAYGITTEKTNYDNALSSHASYLSGLSPGYSDTTSDTPITPATDAASWQAVYTARQALLNKIAAVAGTKATWSGVDSVAVTTSQIVDEAATLILSTTASSVSVLQASGTPLSAASIVFTPAYDCTVQVTVTCTAEQNCTAEQWSTYGDIRVNSVGTSFSAQHQMTRNYSTSNGYDGKSVSRTYNTPHLAGVTRTYYFAVGADVATGSGRSATVNNVLMRLEAVFK